MATSEQAPSYQAWVLRKIQPRQGKNGPLLCKTAPLLKPPKYLRIDAGQAERELYRLRREGLIACTNGYWWERLRTNK